jgi:hypothetical protein
MLEVTHRCQIHTVHQRATKTMFADTLCYLNKKIYINEQIQVLGICVHNLKV